MPGRVRLFYLNWRLDYEGKMPPRQSKRVKFKINLGIISVVVAAIACVAAVLVVPEVRTWLGLDNAQRTQTATSLTEVIATQIQENGQPTIQVDLNDLTEIFPIYVSSTWTYNYSHFIEPTNAINPPSNPEFGQFTITVAVIDSGLSDKVKVIGMKVSGEKYFNKCFNEGQELYTGDLQTWYVLDSESLYIACTREEAYTIANARIANPDTFVISKTVLPMFKAPIEVGKVWPAFADIPPSDDTNYQWYIESHVDVNLPAGEFKDCFRIILNTLGDSEIRWVCPGIGLVAEEYHHRGAINDYRYELQNYSLNTP